MFFLRKKKSRFEQQRANNQTRWSNHHNRPMMGAEMLAVMGMPVTRALANASGTPQADISNLKKGAKAGSKGKL